MKRWPAFSLVEMAIVLMIAGLLLTCVPALIKIHKTHQTKQQMDLAMKSLGAYVAQNRPLPMPDSPRTDSEFVLRGTLPYKELGIKRKSPTIQYAVDRALTERTSCLHSEFCQTDFKNHFTTDVSVEKDLIAFELSAGNITIQMTRNNFAAQCCGMVCQVPKPKKQEEEEPSKKGQATAGPLKTSGQHVGPEEQDYFA